MIQQHVVQRARRLRAVVGGRIFFAVLSTAPRPRSLCSSFFAIFDRGVRVHVVRPLSRKPCNASRSGIRVARRSVRGKRGADERGVGGKRGFASPAWHLHTQRRTVYDETGRLRRRPNRGIEYDSVRRFCVSRWRRPAPVHSNRERTENVAAAFSEDTAAVWAGIRASGAHAALFRSVSIKFFGFGYYGDYAARVL